MLCKLSMCFLLLLSSQNTLATSIRDVSSSIIQEVSSDATNATVKELVNDALKIVSKVLTEVTDEALMLNKTYFQDPNATKEAAIELAVNSSLVYFDNFVETLNGALNNISNGVNRTKYIQDSIMCFEVQKNDSREATANIVRYLTSCTIDEDTSLKHDFENILQNLKNITNTVVSAQEEFESCTANDVICLVRLAARLKEVLEIKDYALKIGIDPDSEPYLLPLATEGLMKALPPRWKPW